MLRQWLKQGNFLLDDIKKRFQKIALPYFIWIFEKEHSVSIFSMHISTDIDKGTCVLESMQLAVA